VTSKASSCTSSRNARCTGTRSSRRSRSRKTYRITREGKAYLRSRRKEIEERFRAFESAVGPERAALFREFRATGKLLRTNMSEVTPKQANELRQVVIEMREKAMRILSK